MDKWKILAFSFIFLFIVTAFFCQSFFFYTGEVDQKIIENIKGCAIGCYIKDYGNSFIEKDKLICLCDTPFYKNMPMNVWLNCSQTKCEAVEYTP